MKRFFVRTLLLSLLGAIAGLVVGYLVFARAIGGYLNPLDLFFPANGFSEIGSAIRTMTNPETVRTSILLSGAVGLGIGLGLAILLQIFSGRRRTRR